MLEHVKRELLFNPRLAKDFPEVVYPLDGLRTTPADARGSYGATCKRWSIGGLPALRSRRFPRAKVSGSTLTVSGLTGSLRGQSHVLATGEIITPGIHSGRRSKHQGNRLFQDSNRTAARDNQRRFVGYGGTGRDGFSRHALHGDRTRRPGRPTLEPRQEPAMAGRAHADGLRFPDRGKVVGDLPGQLREDSFRADGDGREATEFYKEHRAEMDEGATVAWPERFNADEVSAPSSTRMNLTIQKRGGFMAEMQNDPKPPAVAGEVVLSGGGNPPRR